MRIYLTTHTRHLVVMLSLLTIFAACGTTASQGQTESVTATETRTPVTQATDTATKPATPVLPTTVKDKDGKEVTISDVSRIIALNGDIAETIWALGLGPNLVGVDTSATYPAEVQKLQKIGYQRQLASEGILSLQPTVIIGNETAGPAEALTQMRDAGVPVVIIQNPPILDSAPAKIRAIANALGIASVGEQLAQRVEREITEATTLAQKATRSPRVLFLYVRGGSTQSIAGKDTQADAMITAAHGENVASREGVQGYKPLTSEAMVQMQPDILIFLSAGLDSIGGPEGALALPGVAQTPAGQQRNILSYDDLYFLGMTPRVGLALKDLTLKLHPTLQ